jgi:hypothetical protein
MMTVWVGLPGIAETIGEPNPSTEIFDPSSLGRAMRKVRLNADHTAAEILADDDPEVCGFSILSDKIGGGSTSCNFPSRSILTNYRVITEPPCFRGGSLQLNCDRIVKDNQNV